MALVALIVVPASLFAQTYGSINTFSPYSMYGLGELSTQGNISARSMGGVGVAMRTPAEINTLNPAAHSLTINNSVLFSYGMEGSNYFNNQNLSGSSINNSYAAFNIRDIAFQFPVADDMGVAISVNPYSNVGYVISTMENVTDIGLLSYVYEGGGDLTQIKVGWGWEMTEGLSVGLAAQYFWGSLYRSFTMSPYVITGNGTYYTTVGEDTYTVSKIKAQAGVQWTPLSTNRRNLTFGATYDLGGDLTPDFDHTVIGNGTLLSIVATSESETLSLVLPSQLTGGVTYQTQKCIFGFDYTYQDWLSSNSTTVEYSSSGVAVAYNDFSTYKFGVQYTPNRNDIRNYFRRVSYRAGLRYGGYQQTFGGYELEQYAVTAGASFPMKMNGISKVEVGLEYGSRGSDSISVITSDAQVGLIRQDYFKFSLSFTLFGDDYWFQRPKFD